MIVYRVAHAKYKDATLTGIGAEKVGGRWNAIGTRAVYCSENSALALLEYYVHSSDIANLPKELFIAIIEFSDDFVITKLAHLPEHWDQYPYSSKTTGIFTDLSKNRDFFALQVPSSIVRLESNIILNPLYRDFGKVEVIDFIALPVDERLKSGRHK